MKKIVVGLLILLAAFCWANTPPEVTNFSVAQRLDGSRLVDIFYDVADADGDTLTVYMQASEDNGESWELSCQMVSGDIGDNILSGTGKQIIWDFGAEHPGNFGEDYKVRLQVDDHYEFFVPEGMIFVEGGSFEMGDHLNEGSSNELPVHIVTVNSFYIGQYEVTQGEYESVMGSNPSYFTGSGENAPVDRVTWFEAVEYCNALSILEGLTPCYNTLDWRCDYDANGYRLPTEAEWEYAARGGINWENDYRFSGCHEESDLPSYAWYDSNSGDQTHEVGTKLPNQLNIYDLSGNVWEWCNDWYDGGYYEISPEINPTGPISGSRRVLRGGCWFNYAWGCRITVRFEESPIFSYYNTGFRLVRKLESENTAPDMPFNPSPEQGAIYVPVNIALSWECSDPEGDDLSYDVYFGDTIELDESNLVAEAISDTSWDIETLLDNTIYYWKITANDGELQTEGDIWSFTTIEEQSIDWCLVTAGLYTSGEYDYIQTIDYDYEIMKYEVTNAQYVQYLEEAYAVGDVWIENGDVYGHYNGDENYEEDDYKFYDLGVPSFYNYGRISYDGSSFVINVPSGYNAGDFDDHPVLYVSWFGANDFAQYYGLYLPTAQEWEKAARGMTGYEYPWGNNISSDKANYSNSGDPWDQGTTPVGYYNGENGTTDSPSPYGCYDMCGNASEWINSWRYTSRRILRGGFFANGRLSYDLHSWNNCQDYPTTACYIYSFRCARTVD